MSVRLCLCVCLSLNSSETANTNELIFWGMIPSSVDGFKPKNLPDLTNRSPINESKNENDVSQNSYSTDIVKIHIIKLKVNTNMNSNHGSLVARPFFIDYQKTISSSQLQIQVSKSLNLLQYLKQVRKFKYC